MTELPLVVSLGDPAGVGPELIAAAWAAREAELLPPFVVAGGASVLAASAEARMSDDGDVSRSASCAASRTAAPLRRASSTAVARSGISPMAPSAIASPATATDTTAQSCERTVNFW